MGMRAIWIIPVIVSILILGTLGLAYGISHDFLFKFYSLGPGGGQVNFLEGMAVNSAHIFVIENISPSIQKSIQIFDLSGNFVDKFGSRGSGDGQFISPQGIAVNSTHIFVTDTDSDRIQIFDLSGNFVDKFGSEGSGDGQFNGPTGIAVDSSGNIYVIDSRNDRIQIFNSVGVFQSKFGSCCYGDGEFRFPVGIAVDSSSNIYVADHFNYRIQIFNSAGVFQSKFGSCCYGDGQFESIEDIAIDSTRIYVADANGLVQVFAASPDIEPTPATEKVPVVEPEPAPYSKSVYGELKVEKENYEMSYSGTTLVKLFGTLDDSSTRGNKIILTITNPEGDREEFSVIPSKNGYFENFLPLDRNSLLGIYEVSAFTSEGSFIGKISFQLYDKNNPIVSTTTEPAPLPSTPATEKVPGWIKLE